MTREELNEVKAVVRRAIEEEREMYNEVWLTEKELIAQFGMFTHDWLKKYGQSQQPARAIVVDEKGMEHPTQGWAYPKHKIQRMIASGEIMKLRCRVVRLDQQEAVKVKVSMM
jgi:hypothetical protein